MVGKSPSIPAGPPIARPPAPVTKVLGVRRRPPWSVVARARASRERPAALVATAAAAGSLGGDRGGRDRVVSARHRAPAARWSAPEGGKWPSGAADRPVRGRDAKSAAAPPYPKALTPPECFQSYEASESPTTGRAPWSEEGAGQRGGRSSRSSRVSTLVVRAHSARCCRALSPRRLGTPAFDSLVRRYSTRFTRVVRGRPRRVAASA